MKYEVILENWNKFLKEEETIQAQSPIAPSGQTEEQKRQSQKDTIIGSFENQLHDLSNTATKLGFGAAELKTALLQKIEAIIKEELLYEKKDRCYKIAKRKYDVFPSAYASGAIVKCRQGKIWKGVSENVSDEESEVIEEAKKKDYKPNFSKEKEKGLHGWFERNNGKGWVNCRTGGPCGRKSADEGGKYPACRPTKAQCKSAGKGPLRKKKSSKAISWTKKKE